jgi:hypothetical protein
MHSCLAALAILADDECTGSVDQDPLRHAAERAERAGETLTPVVLALTQRRAREDPARVAEHGDEQVDLDPHAGDRDPPLAEVDLHLVTRRRLESHRRELGGALGLTMRREHTLQRPQRHLDILLGKQPLHDDTVTGCCSVE